MLDKIEVAFKVGVDWLCDHEVVIAIIAMLALALPFGGIALEAGESWIVAASVVLGLAAVGILVYVFSERILGGIGSLVLNHPATLWIVVFLIGWDVVLIINVKRGYPELQAAIFATVAAILTAAIFTALGWIVRGRWDGYWRDNDYPM